MNLEELQSNFQGILLQAKCQGADWVADSAQGLSSELRMSIYYNAYRIRLIDVLYDTFEHTAVYLGDNGFQTLAATYVQSTTSTCSNIGYYGKMFPDYLAEQLPRFKEVAELAHMDWTLRRAFDGKDARAITQDGIKRASAAGEEIGQYFPVPTLSISTQYYNTLDIWHSINQDETPLEVRKLAEPVNVLMWRKGYSPHFRSLSAIETSAVNYLCSGYDFEQIGEALYKDFPEADIVCEFGKIIAHFLEDELLTENR